MQDPLSMLAFGAAQVARASWFTGQKMLAARRSRKIELPEALRDRKYPGRGRLLRDLVRLLEEDWRNVQQGLYRPADGLVPGSLRETLRRSRDFFADLPAVDARRHESGGWRIEETVDGDYPAYYLRNFHFQSGGYLTGDSAERYDHQVEVLFGGGAAAMRRQALLPVRAALAELGPSKARNARLLDVACGTGSFLREVKANWPRLAVTGLDLSPAYLAQAASNLEPWSRARLVQGRAEAAPIEGGSFDIVTCIYLFHELPPRTRGAVLDEIARLLKPGGTLVLVDSLQPGDAPDYDGLLDLFPAGFHEPFYDSYLREDLDALAGVRGLRREAIAIAYFSKILTYRARDGAHH